MYLQPSHQPGRGRSRVWGTGTASLDGHCCYRGQPQRLAVVRTWWRPHSRVTSALTPPLAKVSRGQHPSWSPPRGSTTRCPELLSEGLGSRQVPLFLCPAEAAPLGSHLPGALCAVPRRQPQLLALRRGGSSGAARFPPRSPPRVPRCNATIAPPQLRRGLFM